MLKKSYMTLLTLILFFSPLSTAIAKDTINGKNQSMSHNRTQHSSEINVKITTYNLQAGTGTDGIYDLDRIAETIREIGADIVGLQEVDVHWGSRSENENMIKLLAEKLDMYYFFAPIYDFDPDELDGPRRQFGVALLSKYPIMSAENREITRLSTQDPDPIPAPAPGFLEAQIDVDGSDVWFYVTHLDYRADPVVREMQVDDMLSIMDEHDYNILVGDMNAAPDASELAPLFDRFDDAWNMTQDYAGYTYPTESPVKRIDYILASPRMRVNDTNIYQSIASDHLPVTAEIMLARGSHSLTTDGMKKLVEDFTRQGEVTDEATDKLTMHLSAVNYYEQHGMAEKVVRHLRNLKILLNKLKENEWISQKAHDTLQSDATYLIERWEEHL